MLPDPKTLLVSREEHVAHVRFNTPDSGNLVTEAVLDELIAVLTAVRDDPAVRVVTLSGAGPDFSLGGDREESVGLMEEDPGGAAVGRLVAKARQACDALAAGGAVSIARLHGRVVGAGLALALFCDLRAGAEGSTFRMPELALGVPLAWGGALPRLVQEAGAARVRELLLFGGSFDAARAQELAILHRVVPEEELDGVIAGWVRPLVRRSPTALRVTRTLLNAHLASSRLADATLLDGPLMASVLAMGQRPARGR
ncbi:enoyl-CoA hydratase/isomerase family protein [Streptomyces sp. DSM 44917]|uniref:Enoyl-CoA hydratase/isomerase family protein n=1 Tax=Streptomyces boetiae TaxID=3075541 RepID=A0ABU2L4Q2_9ACTN|nr:enoyl-CoA hydratase/isomerase family protein [Streptomyces sp. DSM 44917]MDT0306539.1 enoyl-CoA hydratase/isomerase family protein [Streptomyces sp. DSM 44917]